MNAPTITAPEAPIGGFTFEGLESLAAHMNARIERRDELPGDEQDYYSPRDRTISLSSDLKPRQRRCALATLVAHARLGDTNMNGHSDAEALSLAFQLLVPVAERDAVIRAWKESRDTDPGRLIRDYAVTRRMAAAYSDLAHAWHPEGCVGWDALCGNGNDDDIHSFAPAHQDVSDTTVMVSQSLIGVPGGEYPLDVGLSIDLDLPIMRDHLGSFHVTPDQARRLATFLTGQADAAEAWAANHQQLIHGERSTATPTAEQVPALAGGGAR